jgi:hypothetical protein
MAGRKGMRGRKDNWTDAEIEILVSTILECVGAGKTVREAVDECVDRLGNRTYDATYAYWSKYQRPIHMAAYNRAKAKALLEGLT